MTDRPLSPRRRLGVGAAIVVVIAALAVTVGIGMLRGCASPTESVPESLVTADAATTSPATVYVHVSGAVTEPGLYRLVAGARVVDAVGAAGGFADGADEQSANLARPLTDGEQVHIPLLGEEPAPGAAGIAGDGRVNVNTADATALETLPGIGPALAARIIAWREQNGAFTSADDLLAVPGIGEKVLASLRDAVVV